MIAMHDNNVNSQEQWGISPIQAILLGLVEFPEEYHEKLRERETEPTSAPRSRNEGIWGIDGVNTVNSALRDINDPSTLAGQAWVKGKQIGKQIAKSQQKMNKCPYYSHSPHLKCAVNPTVNCLECQEFVC